MIHVHSSFILADFVRLLLFHSHSLVCHLRNHSPFPTMTDKTRKCCYYYLFLLLSTWEALLKRKWGKIDYCAGNLYTTEKHTELFSLRQEVKQMLKRWRSRDAVWSMQNRPWYLICRAPPGPQLLLATCPLHYAEEHLAHSPKMQGLFSLSKIKADILHFLCW